MNGSIDFSFDARALERKEFPLVLRYTSPRQCFSDTARLHQLWSNPVLLTPEHTQNTALPKHHHPDSTGDSGNTTVKQEDTINNLPLNCMRGKHYWGIACCVCTILLQISHVYLLVGLGDVQTQEADISELLRKAPTLSTQIKLLISLGAT